LLRAQEFTWEKSAQEHLRVFHFVYDSLRNVTSREGATDQGVSP
jgi:hypothetical protein